MALLNILPLPNETSAANPSYNYISEVSISRPRREDVVRVDSNLTPKWRLLGSLVRTKDAEVGPYGIWGDTNIPLYKEAYTIPGYHYLLNLTTTISPTAINEITVDMANDSQFAGSVAGTWTIANTKVAMPTLYSPVGDRIAGFTFGGTKIGNSASGNWPPFQNANTTRELIDNFSKSQGQHTLKLGMVYMHNWKVQPVGGDYNGNYNYGDNGANPLDSGFGFSNAALGVFSSFDQGSRYFDGYPLWNQWEWYAQDTWKVRSRLTLNYGVRFMYLQPVFNGHSTTANFFPQDFVPAIAPQLIEPTLVSGQRTGINPATGLTYPSVDIGAIVPGTGDSLNGLKILGQGGLSKYITKSPGIIPAPRLGFTLDLTGHQNIVLHAGGGMFVDRTQTDAQNAPTANPPNTYNPVVNYGYASQLSLGTGVLSPSSLSAMSYNTPIDHIYNYSIGVESRLPKAMRLDVSYEGGVFNHLPKSYNINAVPFGADFLPQNQDPTLVAANPNALLGSNAMLPQFLRPYVGYGAITMADFGANSNYNSLQVELNRRFATGVFFGAAYTWSKCMNMVDNTNGASVRWDQYSHQALYGPCSWNPTQNLVINYVYQLPKIPSGSSFNNRGSRAILNDWQLSGLTVFTGGLPYSPSFSVSGVSGQNITGTPDWAPDLLCVGNPRAGTTSSPYNRINAAAFAVPPVGSIGLGCARNDLWGPGVNNWDMSLQKNVRLTEHAQIQLRVEAFNVFNHTQFNGVNSGISYSSLTNPVPTNLPYNSAGQLVNINGFGTVSSVLDPRVLQLVAKFVF
jgi:hypothetical protein